MIQKKVSDDKLKHKDRFQQLDTEFFDTFELNEKLNNNQFTFIPDVQTLDNIVSGMKGVPIDNENI